MDFFCQVHFFLFAHFTLPNCEVHIAGTLFLAILSSSSFLFANSAWSNCKVHIAQVNFSCFPKLVGRRLTKHRACHPRHTIPKEDSKSNFKPYCHLGLFFFSILWCSWSDNHPKDDLARFGYRLDMKIEKNQNPSIFLLGLIIKIWRFGNLYFPKSGKFGPFFSPLKILCIGQKNHIFQVKIWQNFAY